MLDKNKALELETTSSASLAFKKVLLLLECLLDESLRTQLAVTQKQTELLLRKARLASEENVLEELRNCLIQASLAFERRVFQILCNSTELFVNHILHPYKEECERVRSCLEALSLYILSVHNFQNIQHLPTLTQLKIKFHSKLQDKILPLIHHTVLSLFPPSGHSSSTPGKRPPREVLAMFPQEMKPLSRFFVSGLNTSHISSACRLVVTRDNQLNLGSYFYAVFTNNSIWFFSFPYCHLNEFQDFLYWKGMWHTHKIFPHVPLRNPDLVDSSHQCYATLLQWQHMDRVLRCLEHKNYFSVDIKTTFLDPHRPGRNVCFKLVGPKDAFWVNRIFLHVDKAAAPTFKTKNSHYRSQEETLSKSPPASSLARTPAAPSIKPPFPSSHPPPLPAKAPVVAPKAEPADK